MSIAAVIARMERAEADLVAAGDARRYFHSTYLRTTRAVADALGAGRFVDAEWVEEWDVVFANLYLDALDTALAGGRASGPWAIAFDAAAQTPRRDFPPLRHVLLGMNAHVNYDLPQALIAVISPDEFRDASVRNRREQDHRHIDEVLASRVGAEDAELEALGPRSRLDRLLAPLNQLGTKRFLTEARRKVWHNAIALNEARMRGADEYARLLAQLEELSAARVADLTAPGQVLLKLAIRGFGVRLPQDVAAAA